MRLLYDVNVLLDFLEGRKPFDRDAAAAWALAEKEKVEAFVSSLSVATVYYLSRRSFGRATAELAVREVAGVFKIASVDDGVIRAAIRSGLSDFEDAIQAFAGASAGATHVVTRDVKGFAGGPLAVLRPSEFLALLSNSTDV